MWNFTSSTVINVNVNENLQHFPELNFMSQNLLSFNISTTNSKTSQKIQAITKEKIDIVFISDIRLNSYVQNYAIHDLEKKIQF